MPSVLSSTTRLVAVTLVVTVGASSWKLTRPPRSMLALAISPSRSVTVAIKVTAPVANVTSSSGEAIPPVGWVKARIWSKVTSPVLTLTVKVKALVPPAL